MKRYKLFYFLTAATIALLLILFVAIPLAKLGTSHLRVVEAINTDESDLLWLIIQAYRNGNFDLGSSPYGILYYNLCLLLTYMLGWITEVTDTHMIIITRMVSFSALVGTSWLVAKYINRFKMGYWGLGFVLTLMGSLVAIRYGLMLHPDLLQVFFITSALYCIANYMDSGQLKWIVISIISAGLAFSSKYSGLILLPLIVISLLIKYNDYNTKISRKALIGVNVIGAALVFTSIQLLYASSFAVHIQSVNWLSNALISGTVISLLLFIIHVAFLINKGLLDAPWIRFFSIMVFLGLLISVLFGITFSLVAPQGLVGLKFFASFLAMTSEHVDGFWFRETSGFFGWIIELLQPHVLKPMWFMLGCFGIVWASVRTRPNANNWFVPQLLPAYWIGLYFVVLTFGVNSKFAHYLLPVLPFFFMYVGYVLSETIDLLRSKINAHKLALLHYVVFVLLGSIVLVQSINYKNEEVEKFQNSSRIAVGEWLDENVKDDIFILADKYIYIPPRQRFQALTLWGISTEAIQEVNPDFIGIQYDIYSQFLDPNRVDEYLHGRELYIDRNKLYTSLLANTHKDYILVKDFGENKLYKKRIQKGR